MLQKIDTNLWFASHSLRVNGLRTSTRMTVIRLPNAGLVLHSPVPIDDGLANELQALGSVVGIIAPNKMHYLYLLRALQRYPQAQVFLAPGLIRKRPEFASIVSVELAHWAPALCGRLLAGMPALNETVWFHPPTRTLISTDFFQWFAGDISLAMRCWASLVGARKQMAVPRHVRLCIRDKAATRKSVQDMLQWPFQRVLFAHTTMVQDTDQLLTRGALAFLT